MLATHEFHERAKRAPRGTELIRLREAWAAGEEMPRDVAARLANEPKAKAEG